MIIYPESSMPFHFGTVLAESGRHFFRSLSQGVLLMAYTNQLLNLLNSMRQEPGT